MKVVTRGFCFEGPAVPQRRLVCWGRRLLVGAEVELVGLGVGAVSVEVDAGFNAAVEDEGVLVELHQPWREDRSHEGPERGSERLLAARQGVAQLARHA